MNSMMAVNINVNEVNMQVLTDKAIDYISQAKSANTIKSYQSDWQHFITYCKSINAIPLPAATNTIINYLTTLADEAKVSTLTRRISAISQAHQAKGLDNPTKALAVRSLMAGIRKVKGTMQHGKTPVLTDDIRAMVHNLPSTIVGIRDRAILLLGFTGAFRRSELASLNIDDLQFSRDGITILLRRSKTDQEGAGRKVGIPYGSNLDTCPVRSIQEWLRASGIKEGALFRGIDRYGNMQVSALCDKSVALIVKKLARAAGLNPDNYSGHSLRAGLATSAAMAGVSERSIMNQTGHRSVNMVRRYIRDGSLFRDNAAAQLGL